MSIQDDDYQTGNGLVNYHRTGGVGGGGAILSSMEEQQDTNTYREGATTMEEMARSLVLELLEIYPARVAWGAYKVKALNRFEGYVCDLIRFTNKTLKMKGSDVVQRPERQWQISTEPGFGPDGHSNMAEAETESLVQTLFMMNPADVAFGAYEVNALTELKNYAELLKGWIDNFVLMREAESGDGDGGPLPQRKRRKRNHTNHRRRGGEFTTTESGLPANTESGLPANPNHDDTGVIDRAAARDEGTEQSIATANESGVTGATVNQEEEEPAPIINDDVMGEEEKNNNQQEEVNMETDDDQSGNESGVTSAIVKEGIIKQKEEEEEPAPTNNDMMMEEKNYNRPEEVNKKMGEVRKTRKGIVQLGKEEVTKMDKSTKEDKNKRPMEKMNFPLGAEGENDINSKKKYQQDYRQYKSVACSDKGLAEHVAGGPIDPNEPRKTRLAAGAKRLDYYSTSSPTASTEKALECTRIPNSPSTGQIALVAGLQAFNPLIHCERCIAKELAKTDKSYSVPHRGHNEHCPRRNFFQRDGGKKKEKKKKRGRPRKKQSHTSMVPTNTAQMVPPPQLEEHFSYDEDGNPIYEFCGVCGKDHHDPNDVSSCDSDDDESCGPGYYWIQCCNETCKGWYCSAEECLEFSEEEAEDVDWRCSKCKRSQEEQKRAFDNASTAYKLRHERATSRSTQPPKEPTAPKRYFTSWIFFNREMRPKLSKKFPMTHPKDMNLMLAEEWRNLPPKEKMHFEAESEVDKLRFEREMEQYKKKMQQYEKEMDQYNASKATSTATTLAIAPGVSRNGSVAASAAGTESATYVVVAATNNNKSRSAETPAANSETNDMMVETGPEAYVLMEESETTANRSTNHTEVGSKSIHGGVAGNNFKGTNNKGSTTTAALLVKPAVASSPTRTKKTLIHGGVCPSNTRPLETPGVPPEDSTSNPYFTGPRGCAGYKSTGEGIPGPKAISETKVRPPPVEDTRRVTASKPEVIDLCNTDSDDEED